MRHHGQCLIWAAGGGAAIEGSKPRPTANTHRGQPRTPRRAPTVAPRMVQALCGRTPCQWSATHGHQMLRVGSVARGPLLCALGRGGAALVSGRFPLPQDLVCQLEGPVVVESRQQHLAAKRGAAYGLGRAQRTNNAGHNHGSGLVTGGGGRPEWAPAGGPEGQIAQPQLQPLTLGSHPQ